MKEKQKDQIRGYKIVGSSIILSVGVLTLMVGSFSSDSSDTIFPFFVFLFGVYLFVDAWTGRSVINWYNHKFKDNFKSTKDEDDYE